MKKIAYILPLTLLILNSCNKDITKFNVNTKAPSIVPAKTLFTQGEKGLVDVVTTTSVSVAPFRILSQEWTENTYVYEAQYNFAAYNANAGFWNRIYGTSAAGTPGVLSNLQAAKNLFPVSVSDPLVLKNDLIITDILEVYAFNLLVSTYGNIPYSQALNPAIPFPKYDDAKTIYADLLTRLDTCIAGLNVTGTSLGSADQIYKGNVAAWLKFAATLKLKMAMLIADVDAATASKKVMEAVATGVFTSNADNASMTYDPSAVGNSNPIWQALVNSGRHDFLPTNLLVKTMVAWMDPRIPLYFTMDPNNSYSGGVPGGGNGYGIYSDFTPTIQDPAYPGTILTYSQTEFLLAEAVERGIAVGGTAQDHYNNAITASILFWGGSATDAATYLAQPAVNYATATGPWRQKLGYQEWVANYNNNWDSWTDIRRLGYPNLDVVNPPTSGQGKLPLRLTYPANESGSNSTNWKSGVAALPGGADVVSAKLFWMP
ncbi:MAG: SusD/RagB family nutrient-binding outer membrane lipoprotein [Bacteroidota bacterium]|nr:SusD/RagB family nutrient-binding outer membrane lipoprotein [Bacteroidota bacterium]